MVFESMVSWKINLTYREMPPLIFGPKNSVNHRGDFFQIEVAVCIGMDG
jgi:hypothetical protein